MKLILNMVLTVLLLYAAQTGGQAALKVDGKPFFPIGWYTTAGFGSVEEARQYLGKQKEQGMNSALICYGIWESDSYMTNALDAADALGMKVMVEVNRYALMEKEGYPLSIIDHQVDLLKDKPAFFSWYLVDEPEVMGVTPVKVQARYVQVKARDPKHPIAVVHCAGEAQPCHWAEKFLALEPPPYCDVLMTDTYPVGENTPEFGSHLWQVAVESKYYTALAKKHGKQAYFNVVQTHKGGGIRLPTFAEQRYLSYAPITVGARGLFYWMREGGFTTEEQVEKIIAPIARQIASLVPVIVSDSTKVSVKSSRDADTTGHGVGDVTYLFGEDSHGGYLIAVNNTPNGFSVKFKLFGKVLKGRCGKSGVAVPVMFEGRTVRAMPGDSSKSWVLKDDFKPFDVNVYRLYAIGK